MKEGGERNAAEEKYVRERTDMKREKGRLMGAVQSAGLMSKKKQRAVFSSAALLEDQIHH